MKSLVRKLVKELNIDRAYARRMLLNFLITGSQKVLEMTLVRINEDNRNQGAAD